MYTYVEIRLREKLCIFMSKLQINNLVRSATFFQHAGISIVFVFMPIIAKGVTDSIFEIGLLIASFSFAQILSEMYFGRYSDLSLIHI